MGGKASRSGMCCCCKGGGGGEAVPYVWSLAAVDSVSEFVGVEEPPGIEASSCCC